MTEKYYEVWFYQENGFASTNYRVKSFKSKEKEARTILIFTPEALQPLLLRREYHQLPRASI